MGILEKFPNPELTVAYKVVQVVKEGTSERYFSANANSKSLINEAHQEDSEVVEYHINQLTLPKKDKPSLFIVSSLPEAQKGVNFFTGDRIKCIILKGYAFNKKKFPINEKKRLPCFSNIQTRVMPFTSYVCDAFLPIEKIN